MPKLVNGISQRMRNFCHAYLELGNATEAYLRAYNTENRKTAKIEGSRLLTRDDIREYIESLNRPIENRIANEREKKRQIIWRRIELCIEKGDEAAIARYMDILNKMDAEYTNINRNIDDTNKLSGLSTEALRNFLDGDDEDED